MMKKIVLLMLLYVGIGSASAYANGDSLFAKPRRLAGFYTNLQGNFMENVSLNATQMSTQWPGLKDQSYVNYPLRDFFGFVPQGVIGGLGVILNNNQKARKFQTQIGVCFNSMRWMRSEYGYSLILPMDSLISSNGGPPLYRDSIFNNYYEVSYSAQYLGLNLVEIYNARLSKRFELNFGLGLKAMYSINKALNEFLSSTRFVYLGASKDPFESDNKSMPPEVAGSEVSQVHEQIIPGAKGSWLFLADASAGASFRLFERRKNHHSLWLNQSMHIGEDILKLSGLRSIDRLYFGFSLGLKFLLG